MDGANCNSLTQRHLYRGVVYHPEEADWAKKYKEIKSLEQQSLIDSEHRIDVTMIEVKRDSELDAPQNFDLIFLQENDPPLFTLLSLAGGLIVTEAAYKTRMGRAIFKIYNREHTRLSSSALAPGLSIIDTYPVGVQFSGVHNV